MVKLTDDQMKKFQETFDLEEIDAMWYACESEYGLNDITAYKLYHFLEGIRKENVDI